MIADVLRDLAAAMQSDLIAALDAALADVS
jgi:hypothetical protein